jgi:hypothetical protein
MPKGGKREGAGKPKKFNVPTSRVTKIVPTDKVDDFHLQTNLILQEYKEVLENPHP